MCHTPVFIYTGNSNWPEKPVRLQPLRVAFLLPAIDVAALIPCSCTDRAYSPPVRSASEAQ